MDRLDNETAETYRELRDQHAAVLADIAAGRAARAYTDAEIAGLEDGRDRFAALVEAYEAELNA
jgi:hypothetical protein